MNNFNWLNIRSYNNSQNNAFEELVCQLAREEEIANKKSFLKIGAPDSGVEAYCILNNGDEYGWQAKYFFSIGNSQWQQLEKSFKTVFEKHSKLIKYYICIPLDRQDPRIPEQTWFMDKWNTKIAEWTKYAKKNERNIEFEYWGSSELIDRLSQEKHAGRRHFWFSKEEFSNKWFQEQVDNNIANLGNRYTPELNFELDIAKIFDGIARDENFKNQFDKVYDDLLKKSSKVINSLHDERLSKIKNKLQYSLHEIVEEYDQIDFIEMQTIDYDKILKDSNTLSENVSVCKRLLYELNEKDKEKKVELPKTDYGSKTNKFSSELYFLRELDSSIYRFKNFITGKTVASLPVLILDGERGIGKSHLISDIVKKRLEKEQLSILLLGQHFVKDENPWTQILRNLLRISCNESEFLGILDAKAQSIASTPAFKFFKKPYYDGEIWHEIHDRDTEKYIGKIIVTTENFLWEEEYDRSKGDVISFLKPSETIYQGMQMDFSKREGGLIKKGELICFDPSVNNKSLSCLLIRKQDFIEFLNKNNFGIFWTVLGEKQILGGNYHMPNRFEISGVYHIDNNKIIGNINVRIK